MVHLIYHIVTHQFLDLRFSLVSGFEMCIFLVLDARLTDHSGCIFVMRKS